MLRFIFFGTAVGDFLRGEHALEKTGIANERIEAADFLYIDAKTGERHRQENFFLSKSFTSWGFARPLVFFIMAPTNDPIARSLPARTSSTTLGFSAST